MGRMKEDAGGGSSSLRQSSVCYFCRGCLNYDNSKIGENNEIIVLFELLVEVCERDERNSPVQFGNYFAFF